MEDVAAGFRNAQVDVAGLPDVRDVSLEAVIPSYTRYSIVTNSAIGLAVAVAAGVGLGVGLDLRWGVLAAAAALVVVAVPLAVYGLLDARRFGWALRDHDVITQQGVLWRKATVLPLVRIQHVETASGPIERAFGVRRLQAYSAGSGSADLVVYGLGPDRVERVRQHLLRRIGQEPGGAGHE